MVNQIFRDHTRYVSITMEFRCNLKCVHCMIEGTMDVLRPGDEMQFQSILDEQARSKKWEGLILTGSEITLNRELPQMSSRARDAGFKFVRIQTHGMHLHRRDYLNKLLDAGVNEFFISVAGATADSHDNITKVPGSFSKMMRGVEMIEEFGSAIIITNTVVTQNSYKELEGVVELFGGYTKVVQHEFWNFFPMDDNDHKNMIVRYPVLMPYLFQAIYACQKHGKIPEIKNVPECLLGNASEFLVNEQPSLFIDHKFWDEFDKNGFHQCQYRQECKSEKCLGLTSAYIKKHGYEEQLLRPLS